MKNSSLILMLKDQEWMEEQLRNSEEMAGVFARYSMWCLRRLHHEEWISWDKQKAWIELLFELIKILLSRFSNSQDAHQYVLQVDDLLKSSYTLWKEKIDRFFENQTELEKLLTGAFQFLFKALKHYPKAVVLLENKDSIERLLRVLDEKYGPLLVKFPSFSKIRDQTLPLLKEPFLTALYDLSIEDREKLSKFTHHLIQQIYKRWIDPELQDAFRINLKMRCIFLPLIRESVKRLPGDRCLTTLLSILFIPKAEFCLEKVIGVFIQELGGLYIKLAQVLADITPPKLAEECRAQQDNAGGLYPSIEQSWKYAKKTLEAIRDPQFLAWKEKVEIPAETQRHFASASMGALYSFAVKPQFQNELNSKFILFKIQRPGLQEVFKAQRDDLIGIIQAIQKNLQTESELEEKDRKDLRGALLAIERSIENYASQSFSELDFRLEKVNADRVREVLTANHPSIHVPHYYWVGKDAALIEFMEGEKVTLLAHSAYLDRQRIADTVSKAYLELVFNHNIVWADPHAGNILYHQQTNQISLIDLNPCFAWENDVQEEFIYLVYRLILKDARGILESLRTLSGDSAKIERKTFQDAMQAFMERRAQTTLMRFVSDFVRLLGQHDVYLKTEVQAALRGLTQMAISANAISARNHFGELLQKHFGWKTLLRTIWSVGLVQVLRIAIQVGFDWMKNKPEMEVGPVLDERDIETLQSALEKLSSALICNIRLIRSSPEENLHLNLTTDGARLMTSAHLSVLLEAKEKCSQVEYQVEVPTREWLNARQEFVRFSNLAFVFCLIECLEQLKRSSLDEYWKVIGAWHLNLESRHLLETRLIANVRLGARKLYARRFSKMWGHPFWDLSFLEKRSWAQYVKLQFRLEKNEQDFLMTMKRKQKGFKIGNIRWISVSTFYRLRIIFLKLRLSRLGRRIESQKMHMHLLPLSNQEFHKQILFGLLRDF